MADDKNLSDDLDEILDSTNDTTYTHDPSRGFTDTSRERTNQFSEDAKRTARDFEHDVSSITKEGKNIALIAHLTIIGWIIALVMNNTTKSEFGSFYIRQVLGLGLCGIVLSFIPVIGWFVGLAVLVLWIMSLIAAAGGEKKLTPVLGEYFQDWFKSL